MPKSERIKKSAKIIARLLIDLHRNGAKHSTIAANFGANAGHTLLGCALFIGDVEGRPMTAAKLAEYVGMPRTTAIRKLREMEAGGRVQRDQSGYIVNPSVLDLEAIEQATLDGARIVMRAAAELSKMDM